VVEEAFDGLLLREEAAGRFGVGWLGTLRVAE
jgi:hypothetical protein